MSVKVNNFNTSLLTGDVFVGTANSNNNSNLAASTNFVYNYFNTFVTNYQLIRNGVSYIYNITGIKSFINLYLYSGIFSDTLSIGTIRASEINILDSNTNTNSTITLCGTVQKLQNQIATNNWTVPITTNTTFNKFQCGTILTQSTGTSLAFSNSFSVGCIPIIVHCSQGTIPRTTCFYNITNTGATVASTNSNQIVSWCAIGF